MPFWLKVGETCDSNQARRSDGKFNQHQTRQQAKHIYMSNVPLVFLSPVASRVSPKLSRRVFLQRRFPSSSSSPAQSKTVWFPTDSARCFFPPTTPTDPKIRCHHFFASSQASMDFGRRRWVKFLSRVLGQQGAFVVTRCCGPRRPPGARVKNGWLRSWGVC